MNKIRKVVIYTILFGFILNSVVSYGANYSITNDNTYVYSIVYILKNNSSAKVQDINITLMLDNNMNLSYQKDLDSSFTTTITESTIDKFGNKLAKVKIDSIPAGGKTTLRFEKTIKSYEINYNINSISTSDDITGISDVYLKPYKKIESDNADIVKKALDLTAGATNNYQRAKKIFEFVNTYMNYDTDKNYSNKGALSALKTKRGVCEDYASLFTALCRALNIPSRVISGFRLSQSTISNMQKNQWYNLEGELHAWPEFYIKGYGWIPVEPTVDYKYNGTRAVYWDGFTKLVDNNYVGVNIINPNVKDFAVTYSYSSSSNIGNLDVSMNNMVKLVENIQQITPTPKQTQGLQNDLLFTDVPNNFWARNSINNMYQIGIIKGYSDQTYKPNNYISRKEFIVMLSRLLDKLNKYSVSADNIYYYNDYDYNDWSKLEYDKLMRFLEAYTPSNDTFAGEGAMRKVFGYDKLDGSKYITREEVCAFLDNFLDSDVQGSTNFNDIENSRFYDSILEVYQNGIITGYKNNTFMPKNNISRAEIATIFERLLKL